MKARLFFLMVICMVSVRAFAADGRKPAGEEKRLSAGTVTVYDFGKVRLHAYNTGDAMADAAFLVEGKKAVVGIELPSFDVNLAEWKAYADSLGKPMNDVIISDHAAGGAYVRDVRVWGTDGARKSVESGAANGITAQLFQVYGPEFRGEELAYVEKLMELAGAAESRAEFVQAAEAAFPGYEGKNYLEMTAAAFFPE